MAKYNPFSITLDITSRVMMENTDVDFRFVDLKGAYAAYAHADPPKRPRGTILLPKIAIHKLNHEQQMILSALCVHEIKHHHWSLLASREKAGENKAILDLANWIEDARIELMKEKTFIGAEQTLDKFNKFDFNKLVETFSKTEKNEEDIVLGNDEVKIVRKINRWGYIFASFFYKLKRIGDCPIMPEMQKFTDIAWEILNDGRFEESVKMEKKGSFVSTELAIEIMSQMQEERSEEFEEDRMQQKGEQENGNQGQESHSSSGEEGQGASSDDDGDGSGSSGAKGKRKSTSKGKQKPSPKDHNSSGQDSEQSSNKEDKGSGDKQEGEKSNEGDLQQDAKNGSDQGDQGKNGAGAKKKDGDSNDGKSGSDDQNQGCNEKNGNQSDSDGPELDSNGYPESIKDEYTSAQEDKLTKIANDMLGQLVADFIKDKNLTLTRATKPDLDIDPFDPNEYHRTPEIDGDPYIPYLPGNLISRPDKKPQHFARIVSEIERNVLTLRRQLQIVLRAMSQSRIERGCRRGEMDPRQYNKLIQGSKRVKRQFTPGTSLDTAVSLLIDLSGSMQGRKAALAVQVATLFGEALKTFHQIPFEVLGYNSSELSSEEYERAEGCGCTRKEIINYWIFKTFQEHWAHARDRLGATAEPLDWGQPRYEGGGVTGGCNCDHENLLHCAARLYERKESSKVLIVLCDGAPSGFNGTYDGHLVRELHDAVAKIRLAKIKLFCFGIMTDDVKPYYEPHFQVINNLEELNEMALRKLADLIIKR